MMHEDTWQFTDDDRARLQPLLDRMLARANHGAHCACQIASTVEGRLEIMQGYCEELARQLREQILQQVDRGEWAARGINRREDISITVDVDARGAYETDADLIHLSMMPTENLS